MSELTRDMILSMEAGPALDALVAERVMGESAPPHPGNDVWLQHCRMTSRPMYSPQKRWIMSTGAPGHGVDGKYGDWLAWHYSHEQFVWDVVRAMKDRGFLFWLTPAFSMGDLDHVRARFHNPSSPLLVAHESTSTLHPVAICRAALLATLAGEGRTTHAD